MPVSNEQLKQRLLEEQAYLLEQAAKSYENTTEGSGCVNLIADDATETFEQSKEVSLQRNQASILEQVQQALLRFEQGTFGICESCGAPIDRARLKAIPYTPYCLECQSRIERNG